LAQKGWLIGGLGRSLKTCVLLFTLLGCVSDSASTTHESVDPPATTVGAVEGRLVCSNGPALPERGLDIAAGAEGVWAISSPPQPGGSAFQVDNFTITHNVQVGLSPTAIAVGGGNVWVANGSGLAVGAEGEGFPQEHSLQRIDPETGAVLEQVMVNEPTDVAYGHESVWVVTADGLVRLTPEPLEVLATIDINTRSGRVVVSDSAVWVLSEDSPVLLGVDPDENAVQSTVTDVSRGGIAVVDNEIWLFDDLGLLIVDELTGEPLQTIEGEFAYGLTGGGSGVWVADAAGFAHFFQTRSSTSPAPCDLGETPIAGAAVPELRSAWFLGETQLVHVELKEA